MSEGQNIEWDKMPNDKMSNGKKMSKIQNVEWDKTPNRNNVERKKS